MSYALWQYIYSNYKLQLLNVETNKREGIKMVQHV